MIVSVRRRTHALLWFPIMATSKTPAAPRKTRVERRNRDGNVMAAAISVMSQRGYAATSIQEIADRVGVLKGSLYHYFSSKEELLARILEESHAEADRIREEVTSLGLAPFDELMEFLERSSLWFLMNVDRAHIYFTEARHLTGTNRKTINRMGREYVEYLHALIVASQEDGTATDSVSDILLTEYVLGALNSVRDWPSRVEKATTPETMAKVFVDLTRRALQAA